MTFRRLSSIVGLLVCVTATLGCGTTRVTDTTRAGSEMLLVSGAVDSAIAKIDCSPLYGRKVFLDIQYLDGTVDKGYVISSLRQHLLAHGVKLLDVREKADVIVEARTGAIGTDRYTLMLLGTPQLTVPAIMAGQPTQIPEISLIKKTDMKGVAKLAVFAYERETGQALWQSGLVDARSTLKDTWVLGAGPFSSGTIRRRTELAGEELPRLPMPFAIPIPTAPASATPPTPGITPAGFTQPPTAK